jgi:predicted peptidase
MVDRARSKQLVWLAGCLAMLMGAFGCERGRPSAAGDNPAAPVPRGEFVARTRPAIGGVMPYRLFVPTENDPQKRYPLIVWLHGAGGGGSDNAAQIAGDQVPGTHTWTTPEGQAAHPAFVLVPQTTGAWASSTVPDLSPALARVTAILDSVQREFPIDSRRVYVLGQSIGGLGAWNLVSNSPERFAAAVILCPVPGDISRAARAARLPIWIFQGDEDSPSFVSGSRALVAALKAAGGRPRYTEYHKAGHDIWTRVFADPEIVPWLFAQSR